MSIRFSAAILGAGSQRSLTDWLLGGLGLSAATISASFAAYMVVARPGDSGLKPSGHFDVFVAFDKRQRRIADLGQPAAASAAADPSLTLSPSVRRRAALPPDVDFTPTGSIAMPRPDRAGAAGPGDEAGGASTVPKSLTGFALRDVFGGKALIETRKRLQLVEPGSILEGAGEVRAIRRNERGWAVETASGTIE